MGTGLDNCILLGISVQFSIRQADYLTFLNVIGLLILSGRELRYFFPDIKMIFNGWNCCYIFLQYLQEKYSERSL